MAALKSVEDAGQDIVKLIKDDVFILAISGLLLFFSPGVLAIFFFYRDLFITLNVFKLLLLAASFTAPFVTLNFILWGILTGVFSSTTNNNEQAFILLTISIFVSSLIFLLALLSAYFLCDSFKGTLIIATTFQFFWTILCLMAIWGNRHKMENETKH